MEQEEHRQPRNRVLRGIYLIVQRYLSHNVGIQGAALAFYLLFTIFPLLIFVNALLGLLSWDVNAILLDLSGVMPSVIVEFIGIYLHYVQTTPSPQLLLFGLLFSIYFPMRATNTLMRAVRTAYRLGPPRSAVQHMLRTFFYTLILILTMTVTIVLLSVTNTLLDTAVEYLNLPEFVSSLWRKLRFPLVAVAAYFALFFLYELAQDTRQPRRNLYPGVVASLLGWLVFSFLFSLYVENIANYSLLYGSIATAMVLLMWLYATGVLLIMGAEFNGVIISIRKEARTLPEPQKGNAEQSP